MANQSNGRLLSVRKRWLASGVGLVALYSVSAWAEPIAVPAKEVHVAVKARPLVEVLNDVTAHSGIEFRLADGLGEEKITAILNASTWQEAAKTLLKGYNYAVESGSGGRWETVVVSGKNGDGKDGPLPGETVSLSKHNRQTLPVRYQNLKPGSIIPIKLPLVTLKGMKKGQKIALDLPDGPHPFVHDNRFKHANGDTTWVGYAEEDGPPYRAMLTLGEDGPMGHVATPEGLYQIVSEAGQSYLIDIKASGLQAGSLLKDQISPSSLPPARHDDEATPGEASTTVTIDLLVLHSKDLGQAETRVNYLSALANQALLDSKAKAQIRVVHVQAVDYTETNDNAQALSDLSGAAAPFDHVQDWRQRYGADLVTLIRPFHAASQQSCGVAWVNGVNGSALSGEWVYSVVSDGNDADGNLFYCGAQTLIHELGHNLGNVHDKALSEFAGAYPYSYAWGVEGEFGTIMSYRQPTVLLFATPLLGDACRGQICGYSEGDPNASDNTRTINQTAPVVAGFK